MDVLLEITAGFIGGTILAVFVIAMSQGVIIGKQQDALFQEKLWSKYGNGRYFKNSVGKNPKLEDWS